MCWKTLVHHDHGPAQGTGATVSGVSHNCLLCEFQAQYQPPVELTRQESHLLCVFHLAPPKAARPRPQQFAVCYLCVCPACLRDARLTSLRDSTTVAPFRADRTVGSTAIPDRLSRATLRRVVAGKSRPSRAERSSIGPYAAGNGTSQASPDVPSDLPIRPHWGDLAGQAVDLSRFDRSTPTCPGPDPCGHRRGRQLWIFMCWLV